MKIFQDPTTLTEFLKQDAAARHSEKAITQVTTAELGLSKDTDDPNRVNGFFGADDSVRISAAAAGRYRTFAGAKTADEQKQQTAENNSFSRRSPDIEKAGREAAQEKIATAREDGRETEQTGAADNTHNRHLSELDDGNKSDAEAPDAPQKTAQGFQPILQEIA